MRVALLDQALGLFCDGAYEIKILVAVTKIGQRLHSTGFGKNALTLCAGKISIQLHHTPIAGQKEQFFCRSFAEYLEESSMAYPEDITKQHLNKIAILLNKIASPKYGDIKPRLGFQICQAKLILGLLGTNAESTLMPAACRHTRVIHAGGPAAHDN